MRGRCKRLVCAALVLFLGNTLARAAGPYDFREADRLLNETVSHEFLQGASLLIVKDGATIHERYFGSYGPSTQIDISTSTRWVTVATIYALADQHIIDLERPLRAYVPDFEFSSGDIELGKLLNLMSQGDEQRHDRWREEWTPERYSKQIARSTAVDETPASFERNAVSGMQIVAYAAERATGMRWPNIFNTFIRQPCKMLRTHYGRNPSDTRIYVESGMTSTTRDYANFLSMILNGGEFDGKRVLSEEAAYALVEHIPRPVHRGRFSADVRETISRYRIGRWVDELNEDDETVQVSSQGRYGFFPWIRFDENFYGVVGIRTKEPHSIHSRSVTRQVSRIVNSAILGE